MYIFSRSETEVVQVRNEVASRHWLTLVNKPSKCGIKLESQTSVATYGEVVACKSYFRWKSGNITQTTAIDFIRLREKNHIVIAFVFNNIKAHVVFPTHATNFPTKGLRSKRRSFFSYISGSCFTQSYRILLSYANQRTY